MIYPQPSRVRRRVLAMAHGLALVALWLAALPWWVAVLLSGGVLASGWISWREVPGVSAVQWGRDGRWQLRLRDGDWVDAKLRAQSSRVWPGWVYLAFRLKDMRST